MVSGPLATMHLADQGADVIKIEQPGVGDLVRHLGPQRGGMTAVFAVINRNKRSVELDLKTDDGKATLGRIVATSDVVVQNFRPGVVERMGIGYDDLRKHRADLVYVSISGFGRTGPYAQKRVYDPIIQAISGLAAIQADRDTGRPKMVRTIIPDKITAMTAAQAITAALFSRERSGKGQHIELAMLDATLSFVWPEGMVRHTFLGDDIAHAQPGSTSDLIYETTDGYVTASTMTDKEWQGMARAMEKPEWLEDERFSTPAARVSNMSTRLNVIQEGLGRFTTEECLRRLEAEDVPCAEVLTREGVLADPQVAENELLVETEHPHAGAMRMPRPAARFRATPAEIRTPAPTLGEHTAEVLREMGIVKR